MFCSASSRQSAGNINNTVCVFAADAHKLFVKDNWFSGMTLQQWIFKPKTESNEMDNTASPKANNSSTGAVVNVVPPTGGLVDSNGMDCGTVSGTLIS